MVKPGVKLWAMPGSSCGPFYYMRAVTPPWKNENEICFLNVFVSQ